VKAKIREHILRSLSACHPLLMPERTLYFEVAGAIPSSPTFSDFIEQLRDIESRGLVLGILDDIAGIRKWKATDAGVAWVRERGA
jgi:hypothetical protein